MPDIDLLLWDRVRSGNKEAFELLFRKYYPILCLFSRKFTNNMDTAREVMQDLFIYLWEHRSETLIHSSFKSYLFRAAKYNSIRRLESDRRSAVRIDPIDESTEDGIFYDHLEYAELQEKILEAIATLPAQCQKVFTLNRFHHLKYSEVAKEMNISVKTVEAHISKALRMIQDYLNNRFLLLLIIIFFFLM